MADDIHLVVLHDIQISPGILLQCAGSEADVVHTGYREIQRGGKRRFQVYIALQIDNIQLTAEQKANTEQLPRYAPAGAEIMPAGRTFHSGGMIGDSQKLNAFFAG